MTMSKFAQVCPLHILQQLPSQGGHYHLILAHDVLQHKAEFRKHFGPRYNDTVILDNSVTELGSAVNTDVITEAAEASHANVVVLPDVYNNSAETIESCREALDKWPQALLSRAVMYVPQGNTWEEFLTAATALGDDRRISWWGVPRNLTDKATFGSRWKATHLLHLINPDRKIHLLGFSEENTFDDIRCAKFIPFVQGIDSAVPIRAASAGLKMGLNLKMPPRGDWWETAKYVPLMSANYEWMRSRLHHG